MGAKTLQGLKDSGAVYLNAVGGAAQFYARCIERTDGVSLMEFGTPEAMWHLWVRDFPGHRHDGCARQQPAQGSGSRVRSRSSARCSARRASLRLDGVEIEQLRAAIAAIHGALIEVDGREILNREQRKRRRLRRRRSLSCSRCTCRTARPGAAVGSRRAPPQRNPRQRFHNRRSGATAETTQRAIRAAQHVRVSCASMNAGQDPQNGQ